MRRLLRPILIILWSLVRVQPGPPSHRHLATLDSFQAMISQGYVPEGYGPDAVVMCTLAP